MRKTEHGWGPDGYTDIHGTLTKDWRKLRDADGKKLNAKPKVLIDWLDDFLGTNPYAMLSNYYTNPIPLADCLFPTGEHAFQAWKATTKAGFEKIRKAMTPDDAKQAGRAVKMRADWDAVRVEVMKAVVAAKFAPGRAEADMLLCTGSAAIVEGNLWNDEIWGVNLEQPGRPGRNLLGTLLMARRAELASGAELPAPESYLPDAKWS